MLKLPTLWPPDAKSQLIGKDPNAGKDWRQEEMGTTEDEMVGWHHQLNGLEFEQTQSLACCSPWGCKESELPRDWTTCVTVDPGDCNMCAGLQTSVCPDFYTAADSLHLPLETASLHVSEWQLMKLTWGEPAQHCRTSPEAIQLSYCLCNGSF